MTTAPAGPSDSRSELQRFEAALRQVLSVPESAIAGKMQPPNRKHQAKPKGKRKGAR